MISSPGGSTLTMSPLPGSPAIDAGGATTLATGQHGLPRPSGLASDIGALTNTLQGWPCFGEFGEVQLFQLLLR